MKICRKLQILAHHEASHAVASIKLGIPVEYTEIDIEETKFGLMGRGYCRYEDGFFSDSSVILRALAGPIGQRTFNPGDPDWPIEDDDILDWLHRETRWGDDGGFTITDLRRNKYLEILYSNDDYSAAFNHIIRHHRFFVRYSIPTDRTVLRHFRTHEQRARRIIESNWPAVERVAKALLADPTLHLTGFEIEQLVADSVECF